MHDNSDERPPQSLGTTLRACANLLIIAASVSVSIACLSFSIFCAVWLWK